jgi:hypothetical protein
VYKDLNSNNRKSGEKIKQNPEGYGKQKPKA